LLLADAIDSVQSFVTVFIWVYTLMIFAYVILSWVRSPYTAHPVVRFLHDVCDPYLRLFRRVLPPLGPVDLSPIVAVAALYFAMWFVNSVILDNLK
jgi:YggT family protein